MSIYAIAEINANVNPQLWFSNYSQPGYVIFHNTIPQKPVQHMSSHYFAKISRAKLTGPFIASYLFVKADFLSSQKPLAAS